MHTTEKSSDAEVLALIGWFALMCYSTLAKADVLVR